MDIRRSPATTRNAHVTGTQARQGGGNKEWLARRVQAGSVVFIGGATLADFRVRVAQSTFRHDLLPGFWSLVGIAESSTSMLSAPLAFGPDPSMVPSSNAVRRVRFDEVDDPERYPNVGVIDFAAPSAPIVDNVRKLMTHRAAIDLPALLLPWLGFVWGAGDRRNPLLDQIGLPSATLVETAFGMAGIELTPGMASGSSCPEAIWQAAVWWHDYYRETAPVAGAPVATAPQAPTRAARATRDGAADTDRPRAIVPKGEHLVRQQAAAVTYEQPTRTRRTSRRSSR
ncbi:MAG TPA: hypothetical protein VFO19_10240 [Vicinamibacterales bacterium]|nr:hypothetical protein [Vicinamibacterales bacterium]